MYTEIKDVHNLIYSFSHAYWSKTEILSTSMYRLPVVRHNIHFSPMQITAYKTNH